MEAERPTQDIFLLVSLLILMLLHPVLGNTDLRRLIMGFLCLGPLIIASLKIAGHKRIVAFLVMLMAAAIGCAAVAHVSKHLGWTTAQWILLTAAFGLTFGALFRHLRRAPTITAGHLLTAASIYLLIAVFFFALYTTIDVNLPQAFQQTVVTPGHPIDLLYFSLSTLTTLGYGDIIPVGPEVRMIAALEAAAGILYAAITVALLVSRARLSSRQ